MDDEELQLSQGEYFDDSSNAGPSVKPTARGGDTLKLGKLKIRYGYMCQGGYRKDEPPQLNKDWYCAINDLGGKKTDAFFAVCDGHGKTGDKCSQYASKQIPRLLKRQLKKAQGARKGSLTEDQIYEACTAAYKGCSYSMQNNAYFNVDFAGTTAISAYIQSKENRVCISNVGDSRAVLGRNSTAIPLSWDQTPYRGSERRRIRETGARILSIDQIDGFSPVTDHDGTEEIHDYRDLVEGEEEESGLRVWQAKEDTPGVTYTRSIGDSIAKELGVIADPELVMLDLEAGNDVIVLASDGIFEFLTNQSVIDICVKCKDEGPLKACEEVICRSREYWKKYEPHVDDMTMICIFIESSDDGNTNARRRRRR